MGRPEKPAFLKQEEDSDKEGYLLSPYQTRILFSFFSDKDRKTPFSAFNGFLTAEEIEIFEEKVNRFLETSSCFLIERSRRGETRNLMADLTRALDLEPGLYSKIVDYVELYVLTSFDFKEEIFFEENLPLPVRLTFKTMGKGLRQQVRDFLDSGGIITVFCYKRPPPFYLEALARLDGGISLQEKISLVLSNRENHQAIDPEIIQASHQFITVDFVPFYEVKEEDICGNPLHFRKIVNRRLDDDYEEDYGRLVLMNEILRGHMDEVRLVLITMSGVAGVFYLIDQMVKGEINQNEYQAFQAMIKVVTHLLANLMDFYSQYKLFLEGKGFFVQLRSLLGRMTWREFFVFANGGFMDLLSEIAGEINHLLGAIVFGLEPLIGTLSTSIAGSYQVSSNTKDKENKENGDHQTVGSRFRILFENPAVLGMNIAAGLTFLTSVALLGLAGQFHNPLAVVAVGGLSEPVIASFMTEIITKRKIKRLVKKITG